jgi:lipopolysaccharide export LptBFGC system permease protein LptF
VIYLPMLNVCAAIQVGHFFVINRRKRSYIGVLCVIALYVALYLWNLAL